MWLWCAQIHAPLATHENACLFVSGCQTLRSTLPPTHIHGLADCPHRLREALCHWSGETTNEQPARLAENTAAYTCRLYLGKNGGKDLLRKHRTLTRTVVCSADDLMGTKTALLCFIFEVTEESSVVASGAHVRARSSSHATPTCSLHLNIAAGK